MTWKRFVAIGDSFTEGIGDPGPEGRDRGWADRLAVALAQEEPDLLYANLAIRGRKLDQIVEEQVPAAIALQPDLVSLAGGVNDAMRRNWELEYVAERFEQAVTSLRGSGADVLVLTFGQPASHSRVMSVIHTRLSEYRRAILAICERNDCMVTDFWDYTSLSDSRFWAEDRLHLNSVGHERAAQAALQSLGRPQGQWWAPLPEVKKPSILRRIGKDATWAGKHFAPWIGRRLTGRSSGDGVIPKRPVLEPVM